MEPLLSYFESADQQRRALDKSNDGWFEPSGDLDLYEASKSAFDPSTDPDEAFPYFDKIYKELQGNWQVFRSRRSGVAYWPSRQVFNAIRREFVNFPWGGAVTLLNLQRSGMLSRLQISLASMRAIKEKVGYPHMVVSKFLHFYNPALFPVYDTAVMENKVFKCFTSDFRDYCQNSNLSYASARNDDTEMFLVNYMGWASYLMSFGHGTFMQVYRDWLNDQPGAELGRRTVDATTLYARAFEYTMIGAEKLACNRQS